MAWDSLLKTTRVFQTYESLDYHDLPRTVASKILSVDYSDTKITIGR